MSLSEALRYIYQDQGRFVFARILPLSFLTVALVSIGSHILPFFVIYMLVVPLTYNVACTISLLPLLRSSVLHVPVNYWQLPYRGILFAFLLQIVLVLGPLLWLDWMLDGIHEQYKYDYIAMAGSGDTPEEAATQSLLLCFFPFYPLTIITYTALASPLLRKSLSAMMGSASNSLYGCGPWLVLIPCLLLTFVLARFFPPFLNEWEQGGLFVLSNVRHVIEIALIALVCAVFTPLFAVLTIAPYQLQRKSR
jgi:hypothetical protein